MVVKALFAGKCPLAGLMWSSGEAGISERFAMFCSTFWTSDFGWKIWVYTKFFKQMSC